MSRITVTKLTTLVLQRRDLLSQLHNIDVIVTRRPSIVKQLDDIEAVIESHRADGGKSDPAQSNPGPGRPQKYGFEINTAVADLTRAGLSEREIGEKLGIPHQSVANMQKRAGVRSTGTTGGKRTPYGPEMIAAVKTLAAKGLSKRTIAKELGIPAGSVDTLKKKF